MLEPLCYGAGEINFLKKPKIDNDENGRLRKFNEELR